MAELFAFTQAELALRFRARQARLPRCAGCGARVPNRLALCAKCTAARQPGIARVVVLKTKKPDAYTTFCAQKRAVAKAAGRAYDYQPRPCQKPGCGKLFKPNAPRTRFCEECR